MRAEQLVASPCSNPTFTLEQALRAYAGLGYRQFELFTAWAHSAVDFRADPAPIRRLGRDFGMQFTSLHLPRIGDDVDQGLADAIRAARFAAELGVQVLLFKAASRPLYIQSLPRFLEAVADLPLTTTVQNHAGTPIATLSDYAEVLQGVNDPRLKTVLEVGMFCTVGVAWPQAETALRGTIALVHLKDQIGEKRVPFGQGTVDFAGLFQCLDRQGYSGNYVVEMEVHRDDDQKTLALLGQARAHLIQWAREENLPHGAHSPQS